MATILKAPGGEATREVEVSTTNAPSQRKHLDYLDALKVALIVLVIAHPPGSRLARRVGRGAGGGRA